MTNSFVKELDKSVLLIILLHVPCLYTQGRVDWSNSFWLRLYELGLNTPSHDYSMKGYIAIPTPTCAYVNVTDETGMLASATLATLIENCPILPEPTNNQGSD